MPNGSGGGSSERDSSSSGVGGFGGFSQPGQRIVEHVTPEKEAHALELKASLLGKSIFIIELMLFVPWILAFLTFGYIVVLVMVEAFVVLFFVAWCRFLEWRARTLEKSEYSINVPFVVCFIVIVLFAVFWNSIIYGAGMRYRLMAWAMALTMYFIIPVIASRALLVYRMGGEVSDQNPRMALSYPKFVWPWSNLGGVAHWDASEPEPPPEPPAEPEQGKWMARTVVSSKGQGSWSFYVPPKGITYLDVWHACQGINENYDESHCVYMWPGLGKIQSLGSKKHYALQNDWIAKGFAIKLANNNVALLHKGIRVMEQVLEEPRPTGH